MSRSCRLRLQGVSLKCYKLKWGVVHAANNAEQYRIWEAMEVGAMPVLKLKNVRRHSHLPELNIPFLTVDAWEELPDLLRHWANPKHAADLEERARDVYVRWADIKTKLHTHIAYTVCERHAATIQATN